MSDGSASDVLQFESSEEEAAAPVEPAVVLDNVQKANAYLQTEMFIAQKYPDKRVIEPPEGVITDQIGLPPVRRTPPL